MKRPFLMVDVFGTGAFSGNPLGVVSAAEGLSDDEMLRIARWLNLSETVFLLTPTHPEADYRVRIFTLTHELPFAGHPTLGSAHAWLALGGKPKTEGRIIQECGVGLVEIRQQGDRLAFAAPNLLRSGAPSEDEICEMATVLRLPRHAIVDAQWVDNGPGWIGLMLDSADAVLAVDPSRHFERAIAIGLIGPHPAGSDVAFEVRGLFNDANGTLIEDPVTGSLNASLGQWLFASGRVKAPYTAAQGTAIGRAGRIHVERDAQGTVWVGGKTKTLFIGQEG